MKKAIFALLFLTALSCSASPVDFSVLNEIPATRANAYRKYKEGSGGDPSERAKSEEQYLKDLNAIVWKLRDTYYLRTVVSDGRDETLQVSDDLLESVDKLARLLENIDYPRNVVAGSDLFYERKVFLRRVHLTELIILRMAKAIVHESWDWDAKGSPRTPFDYKSWLAAWYSSAEEFPVTTSVD